MEALLKLGSRLNGRTVTLIIALVVVGVVFAILTSLSPEQHEELVWFIEDYLPIAMFLTLALLLFSGYPVAFIRLRSRGVFPDRVFQFPT
jgi:hypothetical protein